MNDNRPSVITLYRESNTNWINNIKYIYRKATISESMNTKLYLKTFWMDYIVMIILGAVGLYVNFIRSVPNRLFPVYFRAAKIMNPEFAYPFRNNIIP
ncbi:unnamed protein product, partial [Didymodactylos carnosus]